MATKMDDKDIKTTEQTNAGETKINDAAEVKNATIALIEKSPDGILLTMKKLAEAVGTYDYHARNTLNIIRTLPTISYVYQENNRSYFKPKIYKVCTPAEKLAILNDKKARQFDLPSEQEEYLIGKLDKYNNLEGLSKIYMLCSIVEKLARKGLDSDWGKIEEREFSNFFCLDKFEVYNYIEELLQNGILIQNPNDKTYKLILTEEASDGVAAEIERIYRLTVVKNADSGVGDLAELIGQYDIMRQNMNKLNDSLTVQQHLLSRLQRRDESLAEQLEKLDELQSRNRTLVQKNKDLEKEIVELKKAKKASKEFDKAYKDYVEGQLNKLFADISEVIDENKTVLANARGSAAVEKALNALKAKISMKLLGEELRNAFLNYGSQNKD